MGLSLSEYRCKTLFSLADKDGSHVLDSHEFEVALGLLREEVSATYVPLSLSVSAMRHATVLHWVLPRSC